MNSLFRSQSLNNSIKLSDVYLHNEANNEWIINLLINLLGYGLILIPSAIVVYLVKNGVCFRFVRDNSFVQLFVYGKECVDFLHNDASEEKLLPISKGNDSTKESPKLLTARTRNTILLLYCFFGLQFSYLSWGLLQEKIMTTRYEITGEIFASDSRLLIDDNLVTISGFNKLSGKVKRLYFI